MTTLQEFEDYVLCKAFDVISGDGSYKRYVFQCAENEEPWAVRIHASVARVTARVKDVHSLVERVRGLSTPLSRVCTEIVTSMHAPVRTIPGLAACCLTETQSKNCVDVSRATKTDSPVTIHAKFHYFALMLYFVHRLEHVVRSVTKSWLAQQEPDLSMQQLTERFGEQKELIAQMHARFVAGLEHVVRSLENFLCQT